MRFNAQSAWLGMAALFLGGCLFDQQEQVAGGENFPNTVAPLGKVAADAINSHTQWDQFQEIAPLPDVQASDSVTVATPAGKVSAAKPSAAALGDTVTWDYRDTAADRGGVARRISVSDKLFTLENDTLTYRWDDAARNPLSPNKLLLEARGQILTKLSGKLQFYHLSNLDSTGALDQGDYTVQTRGADSVLRIQKVRMLAGVDGNLDTKTDNPIVSYEFLRVSGGDTLEWSQVLDADGDGVLWNAGDSGVVEFRHRHQVPPLKPNVLRLTSSLKAMIFHRGDSSVPLAYADFRVLKNGDSTAFRVRGVRGDSLLVLGDTALVTFDNIHPSDATLSESHGKFRVLLGGTPWHFGDNALLFFHLDNRWRTGTIRRSVLDFTPDAPVVSGQLDIRGNFDLSLEYEDGGTGNVTGTYGDGTLSADLSEVRAGIRRAFHLIFDTRGNLLHGQETP